MVEAYILDLGGYKGGIELRDELIFHKKAESFTIFRQKKQLLFSIDGKKMEEFPLMLSLEKSLSQIEEHDHLRAEKLYEDDNIIRFSLGKAPSYEAWEAGRP